MKVAIFLCLFAAAYGAVELGTYNVDRSSITVSGISSGAAMASQFHFAHSNEISGCGLFAGVPYLCGNGGLGLATTCMATPGLINVAALIAEANTLSATAQIDSVSGVQGDNVYIFHGSSDTTVYPRSGDNIRLMYQHFGANLKTVFNYNAEHGQPTDDFGAECHKKSASHDYINNCNYKGAFEMLNHLYGNSLTRPSRQVALNGQLYEFDQSEFFYVSPPSLYSMDSVGFVYVPSACADKSTTCKLHIAFHGCHQNRKSVGDVFATKTGYLEAAEVNNIIVVFPQTIASLANPNACWDWWGYVNYMFPTKAGTQILAVYRMMNKVIGK